MRWKELLEMEMKSAFDGAEHLVGLVQEETLDWKPATGANWMTMAQLLHHVATACGSACRGFVTGDWGLPEGFDMSEMSPEDMLPPAEKCPAVESLAQAREMLAKDREIGFHTLAECPEEDLAGRISPAPWDPRELILGHRMLQMIEHLKLHKAQLFYYLKLLGNAVNTSDLWR